MVTSIKHLKGHLFSDYFHIFPTFYLPLALPPNESSQNPSSKMRIMFLNSFICFNNIFSRFKFEKFLIGQINIHLRTNKEEAMMKSSLFCTRGSLECIFFLQLRTNKFFSCLSMYSSTI